MNIKKLSVLLILFLIIVFSFLPCYAKESKSTSIYMWEVNNIDYETYGKMVDYLNINKIYAYIGTARISDKIDSDVNKLLEFASKKNIDIYVVYDENYEDQTENERRIKEFINEIKVYNQTATYKIKGLTIDSEFHSLDGYGAMTKEEQVQLFNGYVNAMKNSYTSAKEANLEYVVCIPVWLNKLDESLLEELIKNGCSYVQLMNYSKKNMITNISEEVAIAKKYNKRIENIAEFQIPGPHEVTDNETFYNDGLEAGINKFEEIDNYYNYELLTFSYHYYKPVIELFNKIDIKDSEEDNKDNNENKDNQEENTNNENQNNDENKQEKDENKDVNKNDEEKNKKEETKNENKEDDTKAKGNIPQTGEAKYIVLVLIIVISSIGIINLIKIRKISKKE